MQALNARRIVAIQFFTLDTMVGEFIPFAGYLLLPLLFRLDKRIFWLAVLYNAGLFVSYYLRPQNFWPIVNVWQALIPRFLSQDALATLPSWATSWLFPLIIFAVLMPATLIFFDWLTARIVDRFYLWKKLKNLFLRWGMIR